MHAGIVQALTLAVTLGAMLSLSFTQDARFVGTVIDDLGRPVQGALVRVRLEDNEELIATASSDGVGAVSIPVLPFRAYLVDVVLDGYESWLVQAFPPPGDSAVSLRVRPSELMPPPDGHAEPLRVANGVISGSLRTLDDQPVAGVRVEAWSTTYSLHSTTSAADGSFRIPVPPGTYRVRSPGQTSAPPQLRSARNFIAHEPTAHDVTVPVSAGRLRGGIVLRTRAMPLFGVNVVVMNERHEPLSASDVRYTYRRFWPTEHTFSGLFQTDAHGRLALGPMAPGPVTIIASKNVDGTLLAATQLIEVQDAPLDEVSLVLREGARALGRVEYAGRDRPLHGAGGLRILAYPPDAPFPSASSSDLNGIVSEDGEFLLAGLAGAQCLYVGGIPPGWYLAEITLNGEDITRSPLEFHPGFEIPGIVVRVQPGDSVLKPHPKCASSPH